jgi:methyl-accepting chemotaxis protein
MMTTVQQPKHPQTLHTSFTVINMGIIFIILSAVILMNVLQFNSINPKKLIIENIILGGLGFILASSSLWWSARRISKSISIIQTNADRLANGDLDATMLIQSNNEIGKLSQTLESIKAYLQTMASTADKIAQGDFRNQIISKTEKDRFANSFGNMSANLNKELQTIATEIKNLDDAANELAINSRTTTLSVSQIADTVQQITKGVTQQSESATRTANSVEELSRAITGVAQGAQEQAQAASKAAEITSQITSTIEKVTEIVQNAAKDSQNASRTANDGTNTVEELLKGMQIIKQKVDVTGNKMGHMKEKSTQIDQIISTIDDIASQTNLLALNAAIEAARAESQANKLTEHILNRQMVSQAQLINQIVCDGQDHPNEFWVELAKQTGLDVISLSNFDGVNVHSSDTRLIGFRYSEDPKEQSYAFRKIINTNDGVVCQPPKKRSIDNVLYKYVGVSRKDQPGVVQIGFNAGSLSQFALQVGGFTVVANEVYRLAESSKQSAKSVSNLVKEIQASMNEVSQAMDESAHEVDNGNKQTEKANEALKAIMAASNSVTERALLAASAANQMTQYAEELVIAVDSVSAVVEENTAATEQMAASSGEVSQSIESIASVSEQNSAAIEEVSASTEEMKAQIDLINTTVNNLKNMSISLHRTIDQFTLQN